MSQWTHVAGIIRVDYLPGLPIDWKTMIGRPVSYHDDEEAWRKCTMPRGSEGSIQYKVIPGEEDCINVAQVLIWGDLRSFGDENVQEILKWWDKATGVNPERKEDQPYLRQAILAIDVERGPLYVITFDEGKNEVVKKERT